LSDVKGALGIAFAASLAVIGGILAACTTPPALLLEGDANSARVAYGGGDLASATAVAKRHCARYQRLPRLLRADIDTADFACVQP
jgi:hypothetical protein